MYTKFHICLYKQTRKKINFHVFLFKQFTGQKKNFSDKYAIFSEPDHKPRDDWKQGKL